MSSSACKGKTFPLPAPRTEDAAAADLSRAISMDAVVLREPGRPVSVETVSLEAPCRAEVLVRVAAAGVCHSDVHLADGVLGDGRWPMVLGHEGAGVVEAVGADVSGVAAGDHVTFCLVPSCGACAPCRSGRPTLCEPAGRSAMAGTLMDGTSRLRSADGAALQHGFMVACFAQYAVVEAASVVPLPASLPLWQAALLGCGVVTGIGAVNRAGVQPGESVCVIGCGGVGLQVIAGARLAGAAPIIAVDRDEDKLERARRRGATHLVDAASTDAVGEVLALSGGGVEHAFEVVGAPATIRQAWEMLRPGGTAVVVGVSPRGAEVSLPAIDFLGEKTITGSYYGSAEPRHAIGRIAGLVVQGRFDLDGVISHFIKLDGVQDALERLRRGEGARSVVLIDEELAGRRL
jgi:S-(hydroxymethyl)glutathione dehydrogenase / alcohol dehydrogenase